MDKKRIIIFSILAFLGAAMVAVSLFLPIVHLIAKDTSESIVYDKTVNILDYLRDAPFISTSADEIYFNSSGPVWMATGSLMFLILPALLGIIMFVLCVLEICLYKTNNVNIKNNMLAKKFSIFTGSTTLVCAVFAIISFVVTTMMANDYIKFGLGYGLFVLAGIGITTIILACLSCKRERSQQTNKAKNSVGFALVALCALVCAAIPFLPFYSEFLLGPDATTMWQVASKANELQTDISIVRMLGDYPFGFAQWTIFALLLVCAFVFVYALVGFIRALAGRSTNWLSSRTKRWTMALAVVFEVLLFLVLCQFGVLISTFVIVDSVNTIFMLTTLGFACIVVPFIPYILSTIISLNKKQKDNQSPTNQELEIENNA